MTNRGISSPTFLLTSPATCDILNTEIYGRGDADMRKKIRIVRLSVLLLLLLLAAFSALSVMLSPNGAFARLLKSTHVETEAPEQYGAFHIAFLAVFLLLVVLTFAFHTRIPQERLDTVIFAFGCFFFVMELYKQLYYHAVIGNGFYDYSVLPLQLCSYVLYLYLLLPLLPEGRCKDVLYRFAAFYQTAAGAIVMFCPLFYDELARSVHTMLWHIAMVVSGVIILLVRGYGRRYFCEVLPAAGVFLALYASGLLLNVVLHPLTANSAGPLNLYYLSLYEETNNLIIGDVRDAVGWFPAVLTYAVLLTFVCVTAVWLAGFVTNAVKRKIQNGKGDASDVEAEQYAERK